MSLDGLKYLLDKNEVVSTASALDLRDRPEDIEIGYLRHVRTFVPMSRFAEGSSFSVEDFERRVIARTRDGKAPRGYIAAGYGYGKTSTALYLWQQGEKAGLMVVPPFQLEKLSDLIDALYGWTRHRLNKKRPALIGDLDVAYERVVNRSLENMAGRFGVPLDVAQVMLRSGALNLEAQPRDYLDFFDAATEIAMRAGYSGILMIPDEIQQFIRPRQADRGDTIAMLFNILQLLGTREPNASLHFGLIMSITLEEIAMIRDTHKRGDLLHRLRELSIDLTDVYNAKFATTLWQQLALTFEFTEEAGAVIDDETLIGLGNISANKVISDGPRTVVNVLKRAVAFYLEHHRAYTPIDMIDDFLSEKIYFKGNDKVPGVTRRMLAHPFVAGSAARYSPAIKLIAAFGVEGVPVRVQDKYGQVEPIAELMEKGIGEIVRVGSNLSERSVALIGLDAETDPTWHKEVIRNFRLGWNPHSRETKERTLSAFTTLLTKLVFPKAKIVETRPGNMVSNHAVILEMDSDGENGQSFPKRRVHIRLYWEDEPLKDAGILGDVCLEYRLSSYEHVAPEMRRSAHDEVRPSDEPHTVLIPINLSYMPSDAAERPLNESLKDVWSPYDLSPLILLNLYQLMIDLYDAGEMPRTEADFLIASMLPEFLQFAADDLFNAGVGAPFEAAGPDISVMALSQLLSQRYPEYATLMLTTTWSSSLSKYETALRRLENSLQRRGDEDVTAEKKTIAGWFTLSDTGFNSFAATYSQLITIVREFRGSQPGSVRFTLHPLEKHILSWLKDSDDMVKVGSFTVRRIGVSQVIRWALDLGYQTDETEVCVRLLAAREIITYDGEWIVEAVSEALNLETLRGDLRALNDDLAALADGYPGNNSLANEQETMRKLDEAFGVQARASTPDPDQLKRIANTLKRSRTSVNSFAKDRLAELVQRVSTAHVDFLKSSELGQIEQAMTDEVEYVDQVNVLRVNLLNGIDKVRRQVEDHQAEVQRVRAELRPDIQISTLVSVAGKLKRLLEDQRMLQGVVSETRERFRHFSAWRTLVKEGASLVRDLHDLRLEGSDAVRERLKDLIMHVRAELSARKLDALESHGTFTAELEAIRRDVDMLRQNARAAFSVQQDACTRLLTAIEVRVDGELASLPFNPADPGSAYDLLYSATLRQLEGALDELQKYVNARQQTAIVLQRQAASLPSREGGVLQSRAGAIAEQLSAIDAQLLGVRTGLKQVGIQAAVMEYDEELVSQVRAVRAEATKAYQELEALRSTVTQLEPTPLESRLRDCVTTLTRDGGTLDLFTLQKEYGDDATFWASLRGLYEKDCIHVVVSLPTAVFTSAS